MAQKRIKDLTAITGYAASDDLLVLSDTDTDADRQCSVGDFLDSFGIRPFAFSALPGGYTGGMIYVTNGRKSGEGAGVGSGVICQWSGSNWITVDAGTTVTA